MRRFDRPRQLLLLQIQKRFFFNRYCTACLRLFAFHSLVPCSRSIGYELSHANGTKSNKRGPRVAVQNSKNKKNNGPL